MMLGPARVATYLGVGLLVAGFGTIFLAWDGAAELDTIQGQFPYLLSGGLAGLGLAAAGATLLIVQTVRRLGAEEAQLMAEVAGGLEEITGLLRETGVVEQVRSAVGARNDQETGQTESVVTAGAGGLVVVGTASFHHPSCHLVGQRDDLRMSPRSVAEGAGLAPCRVCKP